MPSSQLPRAVPRAQPGRQAQASRAGAQQLDADRAGEHLEAPSILLTEPPVELQAGHRQCIDVDAEANAARGIGDLVAVGTDHVAVPGQRRLGRSILRPERRSHGVEHTAGVLGGLRIVGRTMLDAGPPRTEERNRISDSLATLERGGEEKCRAVRGAVRPPSLA